MPTKYTSNWVMEFLTQQSKLVRILDKSGPNDEPDLKFYKLVQNWFQHTSDLWLMTKTKAQ